MGDPYEALEYLRHRAEVQLFRAMRNSNHRKHEVDAEAEIVRERLDRLAELEDGIRALADKWEKDANSLRDGKTVQAHAEADTLQDCAGFARALLDGE